jgi:hypothetical protein
MLGSTVGIIFDSHFQEIVNKNLLNNTYIFIRKRFGDLSPQHQIFSFILHFIQGKVTGLKPHNLSVVTR